MSDEQPYRHHIAEPQPGDRFGWMDRSGQLHIDTWPAESADITSAEFVETIRAVGEAAGVSADEVAAANDERNCTIEGWLAGGSES